MSEKVLSLHIRCLSEQAVVTKDVTYKQILFDGSADGSYFTGEILPGGVDTQEVHPDGTGRLFARYMLRGVTQDGKPAMLYIENQADMGATISYPVIYADTPALEEIFAGELQGRIDYKEMGSEIEIYKK